MEDDSKQDPKVKEFCSLLESSKQLFNALRDVPHYGQMQWQSHFAKTFESYTRLWKFQQENRTALDKSYNLKRWQIGEIANKIGQLYYHYYLRTSEAYYLKEAYQFYSAIRSRNYYKSVDHEKNGDALMLKKYRYYARFIVVCLLLNYRDEVTALVKDLSRHVSTYTRIMKEEGEGDWEMVIKEINNFPDADPVEVLDAESYQKCHVAMRLQSNTLPACDSGFKAVLSLGDVIVVGNSPSQCKFSEFTIDMLRMVHVLERVPASNPAAAKRHPTDEKPSCQVKRDNPHKYLLYRPDIFTLLAHVSAAIKELPPSSALLLYLSSQGRPQKAKRTDVYMQGNGYNGDGVITNDLGKDENNNTLLRKQNQNSDTHCLQAADLHPFLRKPLLLIVDSDNSTSFRSFPNLFDQPFICLMSPTSIPYSIKCDLRKGRLMTIFFYSPVMAFLLVCGIERISSKIYQSCAAVFEKVLYEIQRVFMRSKSVEYDYLIFFGDEFLRLILLRFAFFACTLNMHRNFRDKAYCPSAKPSFPVDFFNSSQISRRIMEMAEVTGTQGLFEAQPTK